MGAAATDAIRSDVKIIHLERDPLFTGIPGWGFPADLPVTACSEIALPVLNSIIKNKLAAGAGDKGETGGAPKKDEAEHNALMREIASSIDAAKNQKPINPLWASKCIGDIMDDKTIIFNETVTSKLAEVIPLNRPGSQFSTPPAGHLGWGLGAAVGAKLGAPDATVIAAGATAPTCSVRRRPVILRRKNIASHFSPSSTIIRSGTRA